MTPTKTLELLRIARPCSARWEEMAGDTRVRFCAHCQKNVYNLSALSREDATRLVQEKEGKLCALFYTRRDGTVLTSDCPVGAKAFAARVLRRTASALAGLFLLLGVKELAPETSGQAWKREAKGPQAPAPKEPNQLPPEVIDEMKMLGSLGYVGYEEPAKGADSKIAPVSGTLGKGGDVHEG